MRFWRPISSRNRSVTVFYLWRGSRSGILRSEIREGLWTADRLFDGDPGAESSIRDQIDAWSLSLIKRQGVSQSVVGAELFRKGPNLAFLECRFLGGQLAL